MIYGPMRQREVVSGRETFFGPLRTLLRHREWRDIECFDRRIWEFFFCAFFIYGLFFLSLSDLRIKWDGKGDDTVSVGNRDFPQGQKKISS